MKEKKYKNGLIYTLTVITVVIVYLVIHLFGEVLANNILQEKKEYEKSIRKQPVNHIVSIVTKTDDKTPPTVNLEENKTLFTGKDSVEVCAICTDEGSGCKEERICKTYTKSARNQTIIAYDNAGNSGASPYFNVIIDSGKDTMPPTVRLEGDLTHYTGTGSVEVCAICTDSGSGCKEKKVCKKFTESVTNQTITVYDKEGNSATTPVFNVTIRDTTPPTVRLEENKTNYSGTGSVEVCAICTDSGSGCVKEKVCHTYTNSASNQTITMYDKEGNEGNSESFSVTIIDDSKDTTPPTVRLEGDKTNFTGTGSVEVCAICMDSGSGCVKERVCKTFTESVTNQTITVYDKEENSATSVPFSVTIKDTTPPTVRLEEDKTNYSGSGVITVCAVCQDSGSGCVEERTCKAYTESVTNQTITMYDKEGNNGTTVPFNVTIIDDSKDTTPPTVRLEENKTNYSGTGSVEVCAVCTDADSGCVKDKVCKTFTESATNQTITMYDRAGNSGTTVKFNVEVIEEEPDDIFVYLEEEDRTHYINLTNQFPITDEVGKNLEGDYRTFDFKLKLKPAATGVNYVITIEKLAGSDLDEDWVKVYLDMDGTVLSNCYRTTGRIKTFNEYAKYNGRDNEKILYEGVVSSAEASRGYINFTHKMWISEDVELHNQNLSSKTMKARINVYAVGNNS